MKIPKQKPGKGLILAGCFLLGILFSGAGAYTSRESSQMEPVLDRGEPGEREEKSLLFAKTEDGREIPLDLAIPALPFTEEGAEIAFDRTEKELFRMVYGEEPGTDRITENLKLRRKTGQKGVTVSWKSSEPDWITSEGELQEKRVPEEGIPVELEAEMKAGKFTRTLRMPILLVPREWTEEEQVRMEIREQLEAQMEEDPLKLRLRLPDRAAGKTLTYHRKIDRSYRIFPVLGLTAGFVLGMQDTVRRKQEEKERREGLTGDYADIVYHLMIYAGAGFSISSSWRLVVQEYRRRRREEQAAVRPGYEEMERSLQQMEYGGSERQAMEEFGKRCGLPAYRKLAAILEQTRRMGANALQEQLEQEMKQAWEEKKMMARRAGEEAQTKLMGPLFLMLILVLVLVMVPAFMTMG